MIGNIHKITKRNLLKGIPWRFGLIGQVKGAKQKPEEVHYVKDPLNYQWVDVDYMAALAQGLEPRTV